MRDLILVAIILGSAPVCFVSPYFGVLMWYWVSYFNPHRFTWSYGYDFPVALVIAVPTLAGTLIGKKSFQSLRCVEAFMLAGLWVWFALNYLHARGVPLFVGHMADAQYEMIHMSKILLMTFVMMLVITSKDRIRGVTLVTAGSLGLLAVKGLIFGLRTEGEARVWGPPDSFLADNNALALALNMTLPLMYFLARDEQNRWIKWFLRLCFVSSIASVLLTYSRGGMLGLMVVLLAITLKSRHKILSGVMVLATAVTLVAFAPGAWMGRMSRFLHGNLDSSANQRLVAWETAWNFSQDYPLTGGSFDTLPDVNVFQRYQSRQLPEGFKSTAPHSVYFQLIADQGFVGLGLFLAMIGSCLWSLRRLRRMARVLPSTQGLVAYTHMLEVSILGFMVSGTFLGYLYLDVIYQIIALVVILKALFKAEVAALASEIAQPTSTAVIQKEAMVVT